MRRLIFFIGLLELYALLLMCIHLPSGVLTDEAKYLLNIPYPHPPLVRQILGWTAGISGHEFFWRFVIASALVQAVWLLVDIAYVLPVSGRKALVLGWLLSAAVVLQAGTVMMAPLTGLFGLLCVYFALRSKPIVTSSAPYIGCLWLVGLFSFYQAVLFLPLFVGVLRAGRVRWSRVALYLGIPLLLLVVYTLGHPLALASILKVSVQDAPLTLMTRFWNLLFIYLLAGGGILSIVGGYGLMISGRRDLQITMVLLLAYIFLSGQEYYAILLTPLLIAGLFILLCRRKLSVSLFVPLHILSTILFVSLSFPSMVPTPARAVMQFLAFKNIDGPVLVDGLFGHEWQYESLVPLGRYSSELSSAVESKAQAIVCTKKICEDDINDDEWVRMNGAPIEIWVRR